MSNKYCCDYMLYQIEIDHKVLEYDPVVRTYSIILYNDEDGTRLPIWHCPWCGAKLPKELGEELDEILEKEYGIKDPCWDDKDRVPPEFFTDEWWKKRGL